MQQVILQNRKKSFDGFLVFCKHPVLDTWCCLSPALVCTPVMSTRLASIAWMSFFVHEPPQLFLAGLLKYLLPKTIHVTPGGFCGCHALVQKTVSTTSQSSYFSALLNRKENNSDDKRYSQTFQLKSEQLITLQCL